MIRFFQKNIEPNRKLRIVEVILLVLLIIGSIASYVIGFSAVRTDVGQLEFVQSIEMQRDFSMEDYDGEEDTVCDVTYRSGDKELVVTYSYEEYEQLDNESITAYEFEAEDGTQLYFDHQDVTQAEAQHAYEQIMANESMPVFNFANASMILVLSLLIMMLFARQFTYEKSWFMSIMVLATIFSVMFPEESANGVNGIIIMWLYLLDTFLNILCELLISKQSRYNFLVSVLVEIVEIVISIVLMYRFATLATTLFFWLPIDIISYINWSRHKDEQEDELTVVRRLAGSIGHRRHRRLDDRHRLFDQRTGYRHRLLQQRSIRDRDHLYRCMRFSSGHRQWSVHLLPIQRTMDRMVYLRSAGSDHQHHLRTVCAAHPKAGVFHQYDLRLYQVEQLYQVSP